MIKHIVLWKLKDFANGKTKEENALLIKEKLESLNGRIPGLVKIEAGLDFSKSGSSFDIALYSEFKSEEALQSYQVHPLHKEVVPFIGEATSERIVVDYLI